MSIQDDKTECFETEMSELRPDRLASTLLILGFILVSLFGFYSILSLFVAGRFPPSMLPILLLGGSGILYGRFRSVRGNSATKLKFKTTRQRIQIGATAGSAAAFCVYLVTRSEGLNMSWLVPYLILSIVWALLLGIPAGGIGGLILAAIWKNKIASFVGGAIAGAIFSLWWFLVNLAG